MTGMNRQYGSGLDIKSIVVGVLLGVLVVLAAGNSIGAGGRGRYDCCTSSTRGVFIVDTQTGHTWELTHSSTVDYGTLQDRKSRQADITPLH